MTKKKTLATIVETITAHKRRLAYQEKAYQDITEELANKYKFKIRQEQSPREDIDFSIVEDGFDEDSDMLEKKKLRLSHEISALTDLIEEAEQEAFNFAELEISHLIPERITALQALLHKKRESILSELMKALEHVSSLHWRLNGTYARIPWEGLSDLKLPILPREAVLESNDRLDILFKSQPKKDDPYAIELKIRELKEKQAKGPQKLVEAVMADAR